MVELLSDLPSSDEEQALINPIAECPFE